MTCIAELLAERSRLAQVSETPRLDTELLLCHCLGKNRAYLRAWPQADVSIEAEAHFFQLLERRERGEPIAYLTGQRDFWSLSLACDDSTLIPRPDTERLVELALEKMPKSSARALDLGTGTGAIALALAVERPRWQIDACDIQPRSVALAEHNRAAHQLENVRVFQSDWFSHITGRYDLIVSNPPYIEAGDRHLQQGDLRFEPDSALVAGNFGMAAIETIAVGARDYLFAGAWLLLEHGYDQAERVRQLLLLTGYHEVQSWQDLGGNDRVTGGRL